MSPSLLIEKLESLLPEIKRTGDPGSVLLKYATDENLAPAQLEKMAHQYNTAKTLAYMNKAANRGGSFSLVDTEDLLARYTQQDDESKSASDSVSNWVDAPKGLSTSRFPDMEILEMTQALKAAAAALPPEPVVESYQEKEANARAARKNYETLLQIRDDNEAAAMAAFDKLATRIYDEELPFPEIEDDAFCLMGKRAAELFPVMLSYMEKAGYKFPRMVKAANRAMARDRHDVLPLLEEAYMALDTAIGVKDLIKSGTTLEAEEEAVREMVARERAAGSGAHGPDYSTDAPEEEAAPQTPGGGSATPPTPSPHKPKAPKAPKQPGMGGQNRRAPAGGGKSPPNSGSPASAPGGAPGGKPGGPSEGGGDELQPLGDELGKGWDSYLDWGKKLHPLQDPLKGVQRLVSLAQPGRNGRQEKIDTAADDSTFQSGVARLIHTDPILSEADPNMVADLANSIRSTNPQAALDLNYLKFTLREAVQYGALPHHTTKDLLTMRKDLAQAQKAEGDNADRTYGGAKPGKDEE